jgi:ribosomal protein S18 acetylase RimI-like enzyme
MPDNIAIVPAAPPLADYHAMIRAVGWGLYVNFDVSETALANSLYTATAYEGDKAIGFVRVVGDGAVFFYIQDLMVLPEYQRRGIGTALLDDVMAWLNKNAPKKAYVSLFTGKAKAPFYERYGFEGPEKFLYGMAMKRKSGKKLGRAS